MQPNLEKLREEIQSDLESRGIAVFHGAPATLDDDRAVYWDTEARSDYREFVAAAQAVGVQMIALWSEEFEEDTIDQALKRMAESAVAGSERTAMERRLREMRRHDGVVCRIEMSFDFAPRTYVFELRADWFRELDEMLERIEGEAELPAPPQAGYFSKN